MSGIDTARSRNTTNSNSIHIIPTPSDFPDGVTRKAFISFLAEHLGEYGDPAEQIESAIDYAFSESDGRGGLLIAMTLDGALAGAMVIADTGMSGFIPEYILVYFAVDVSFRGQGLGSQMMSAMRQSCNGDIALHVEPDNPARHLYERHGFTSKYVEMRLHQDA